MPITVSVVSSKLPLILFIPSYFLLWLVGLCRSLPINFCTHFHTLLHSCAHSRMCPCMPACAHVCPCMPPCACMSSMHEHWWENDKSLLPMNSGIGNVTLNQSLTDEFWHVEPSFMSVSTVWELNFDTAAALSVIRQMNAYRPISWLMLSRFCSSTLDLDIEMYIDFVKNNGILTSKQ